MSEYVDYYRYLWRSVLSMWQVKLGAVVALLFHDVLWLALAGPAFAQATEAHDVSTWREEALSWVVYIIGPLDRRLIMLLFILFCLDLIFGTGAAIANKTFTKSRLGKSVLKLLGYGGFITLAWQARTFGEEPWLVAIGYVLSRFVEGFLLLHETISVIENLDAFLRSAAGVSLPLAPRLLAWLREKLDEGGTALLGRGKAYRVLLVENDAMHREIIKDQLARPGAGEFKLEPAVTLREGLMLAREYPFEVCILDLGLPDSDGFATFMAMREAAPALPIILFTANDDPELKKKCELAGSRGYLRKGETSQVVLLQTIVGAIMVDRIKNEIATSLATHDLGKMLIPAGASTALPSAVLRPDGDPQKSGEWVISDVPDTGGKP